MQQIHAIANMQNRTNRDIRGAGQRRLIHQHQSGNSQRHMPDHHRRHSQRLVISTDDHKVPKSVKKSRSQNVSNNAQFQLCGLHDMENSAAAVPADRSKASIMHRN